MIYILLGPDDFSKREFSRDLEQKEKLETILFFDDAREEDILREAQGGGLFGGAKISKVYNFISKGDISEEFIEKLKKAPGIVLFFEDALDKRKAYNKKLLADKSLNVQEFKLPSGDALRKWIQERSSKYDLKVGREALALFMQRMGDGQGEYGKELYSLWQIDSELKKMKAYAGDKEITAEDVLLLIPENLEENVFKITNAIGDKDRAKTTKYLNEYLDRIPGDEKGKIISLSALLADQFRSILIIQDLSEKGSSDNEIAGLTGYSSGRVFVYKKIARGFKKEKVLEALKKLEYLDEELKSENGPASLQFFMIIDSVLK